MITFARRKSDFLFKKDKSSAGHIDERIRDLCNKLNKKPSYYTLSSCSGRVVLIKSIGKKLPNLFVFKSHEKINFPGIKNALENYKEKENLVFKQEPCILHIACSDLKSAHLLLLKAQGAGLKHSGIIALSGNRIVCELIGSEQLAFPIIEKRKILVNDNFLKILAKEANKRLEKSWKKMNKLRKCL